MCGLFMYAIFDIKHSFYTTLNGIVSLKRIVPNLLRLRNLRIYTVDSLHCYTYTSKVITLKISV